MTLRVAFLHAARRDFEDAALWYEERRSGLGPEFRAEVDAAVSSSAFMLLTVVAAASVVYESNTGSGRTASCAEPSQVRGRSFSSYYTLVTEDE